MDAFDRQLLDIVQADNRRTHEDIGREIGLSPSAVRRRLTKLRDEGIIIADVSLLGPAKLGETVIISLRMETESHETYGRLQQRMLDCPEVTQCYTVCGETDFIIIGHFSDLAAYDQWAKQTLMSDDAIARYTTNVVSSRVKFSPSIPIMS